MTSSASQEFEAVQLRRAWGWLRLWLTWWVGVLWEGEGDASNASVMSLLLGERAG